MRTGAQWLFVFIWVLAMAGAAGTLPALAARPAEVPAADNLPAAVLPSLGLNAPLNQSTALSLINPNGCPGSGCAAGQRLSMRFDFMLTGFPPGATDPNPNVKVCFYAPNSWGVSIPLVSPDVISGETTGRSYTRVSSCGEDSAPPANYSLIMAREALLDPTSFQDRVGIAFRLAKNASGNGAVLGRVFVNNGGWALANEAAYTLVPTAYANPAFVASTPGGCGDSSPCYVNSGDDLALGLGTGLKDAIDASDAGGVVTILGNYTIKSNTVLVNQPVTITGAGDATLTFNGPGACSGAMLALNEAVTVRNLNINDGVCSVPGRTLLEINTPNSVLIESNDLTDSDNAIIVRAGFGAVTARYNHISGNAGYALLAEGTSGGSLEVFGNNMHSNRSGPAIECADSGGVVANRRANHNYWGSTAPTGDNSRCSISAAKRLGAPITQKSGAPGVNVQLVNVTESKAYAFDNQIAYRRSGGSNFGLYIVDHGYANPSGPPFSYAAGEESISPCSNAFDVFLPDGTSPSGSLELFVRYDKTAACEAVINSSAYCGQTINTGLYPLYWYDPSLSATLGWDTTGKRPERLTSGDGQTTSCNSTNKEIQVSIDNSGRPNLSGDLSYTPFMVGIPILRSFKPLASNQMVTVTWTTNNEPDVAGFYLLTSLDGTNFTQNPDIVQRTGTSFSGRSYLLTQTGLTNGTTIYYRLRILRTDGISVYSAIEAVTVNVATITPTFTASPVFTRTLPFPTFTPFPTRVPTRRPTIIPSPTRTLRPVTPSPTIFQFELTPDLLATDATGEAPLGTEVAFTTGTATLESTLDVASATTTPSVTPTPAPTVIAPVSAVERYASWISLLLGILGGSVLVGGIAGLWWWRQRG